MDRVWPLFVLLPGLPPVACHHPGGRRRKRRKTPRKANDTGWCSLRQNNEQKYSYCMAENNMFFCVPGIPPESPNTGMKQGEGGKRKQVFDVACLCHIMAFTKNSRLTWSCVSMSFPPAAPSGWSVRGRTSANTRKGQFFYCGSSLLHNLSSAAESSCPPVSGLMGEGSTATAAAAFTLKAEQSRAGQSEERRWKERLKKREGVKAVGKSGWEKTNFMVPLLSVS